MREPARARPPTSRRSIRASAFAVATLASLAACASRESRVESVVVLTIDTLRADQVGAWGGPAHTPNLDRLAAEALVFERAYTQAPITHPALSSLWTGLLPTQHGVTSQFRTLRPEVVPVPQVARAAGLETGAFVANLCGFQDRERSVFHEGFDTRFCGVPDEGEHEQWEWDRAVVAAGVDWLSARDVPFLAWFHLMDPHSDHRPPPHLWDWASDPPREGSAQGAYFNGLANARRRPEPEEYERLWALYRAEVAGVDEAIAPLLAWLDRPEARGRVALVVAADHGEELFESLAYYEHGDSLSDGVLHVPLLVRAPHLAPARFDAPVELLQVAPTVLDLLGLAPPYPLAGRSLLDERPAPTVALSELHGTFGSVRDGEHRLWPGTDAPRTRSQLVGPWRARAPWYQPEGALARYPDGALPEYLDPRDDATRAVRAALVERLEARLERLDQFTGSAASVDDPELLDELRALGYAGE